METKTLDEVEQELNDLKQWKYIDPESYLIELIEYINNNYLLIKKDESNN